MTTIRLIGSLEALMYLNDPDASITPFATLTAAGYSLLLTWLDATAKDSNPTNFLIRHYKSKAEESAMTALIEGGAIIVEMKAEDTLKGTTQTLVLQPDDFAWNIKE